MKVMSKNGRLSRVGVLAPAALSACMGASVLAVPAASAIVSTVLKELSKAFMLKKWFHGSMSAKEAEHLMMEKGKNGSFLVRESRGRPGDYVLTVRVKRRVSHVVIRSQHNKYDVGSGEHFDDLVGLIEHFRSYPIVETSGDVLRLGQPLSGTSVKAQHLDKRVEDMQHDEESQEGEDKACFVEEFQALQLLDSSSHFTTVEACKPENASKNRYRNILPYDQTRVVLRNGDEKTGGDYINASYIRPWRLSGDSSSSMQSSNESLDSVKSLVLRLDTRKPVPLVSKSLSDDALREMSRCVKMDRINGNLCSDSAKDKVYIAAQGCLSNTKCDFWRMIWQEDVRIIVMITKAIEKGKVKCEKYWPDVDKEENFDGLKVVCLSERFYENYLVRELKVCDEIKNCRNIYQYQYTAWPDHGAPNDHCGVVGFIHDINKRLLNIAQTKNRPDQKTLCVHCSAGVGRTGTFIALDMLIDKIKSTGVNCDLDVHNTVKLIRGQRCGMVQNNAQYRFIYLTLQEYVKGEANKINYYKKIHDNVSNIPTMES